MGGSGSKPEPTPTPTIPIKTVVPTPQQIVDSVKQKSAELQSTYGTSSGSSKTSGTSSSSSSSSSNANLPSKPTTCSQATKIGYASKDPGNTFKSNAHNISFLVADSSYAMTNTQKSRLSLGTFWNYNYPNATKQINTKTGMNALYCRFNPGRCVKNPALASNFYGPVFGENDDTYCHGYSHKCVPRPGWNSTEVINFRNSKAFPSGSYIEPGSTASSYSTSSSSSGSSSSSSVSKCSNDSTCEPKSLSYGNSTNSYLKKGTYCSKYGENCKSIPSSATYCKNNPSNCLPNDLAGYTASGYLKAFDGNTSLFCRTYPSYCHQKTVCETDASKCQPNATSSLTSAEQTAMLNGSYCQTYPSKCSETPSSATYCKQYPGMCVASVKNSQYSTVFNSNDTSYCRTYPGNCRQKTTCEIYPSKCEPSSEVTDSSKASYLLDGTFCQLYPSECKDISGNELANYCRLNPGNCAANDSNSTFFKSTFSSNHTKYCRMYPSKCHEYVLQNAPKATIIYDISLNLSSTRLTAAAAGTTLATKYTNSQQSVASNSTSNKFTNRDTNEVIYTYYQNACNAFSDVKQFMSEIDAACEDSNDLWYRANLLYIELSRNHILESVDMKNKGLIEYYDNEFTPISTEMQNIINSLNHFKSNLDENVKPLKFFTDNDEILFGSSYAQLLSGQYSKVALAACEKKNTFEANYEVLIANIEDFKINCSQVINMLAQIITSASSPDYNARMPIDDVNDLLSTISIDEFEENFNSLVSSQQQLLKDYDVMCTEISTVYDSANLQSNVIADYQQVLEKLIPEIDNYKVLADENMKSIQSSADVLYCRYVDLYNSIMTTVTPGTETLEPVHGNVNCSEVLVQFESGVVKSNLAEVFKYTYDLWLDLKDYVTQTYVDEMNLILKEIIESLLDIQQASIQVDDYVKSYNEHVSSIIDSTIANFKSEYGNFKNIKTLTDANKLKDLILDCYSSCIKLLTNETSTQFATKLALCSTAYEYAYNMITVRMVNIVAELNAKISVRKRNIIRYGYASRILAYLFGHYQLGAYMLPDTYQLSRNGKMLPWKTWLKEEISECLIPPQFAEIKNGADYRLDVFNTLMLYTPIVPLIWPYGDSDIEKEIQTSWNETSKVTQSLDWFTFVNEKKELFVKYVQTTLVKYICTAIVNTMDKTCKSALETFAEKAGSLTTNIEEQQVPENIKKLEKELETLYQEASSIKLVLDSTYQDMFENASMKDITKEQLKTLYGNNAQIVEKYNKYQAAKQNYDKASKDYANIMNKISPKETTVSTYYREKSTNETKVYSDDYYKKFVQMGTSCADVVENVLEMSSEVDKKCDAVFVELCKTMLNPTTTETHDNYWKLLRTVSGKLAKNTNETYKPTFFPANFPINNAKAERSEAVIIILNRIIDKLGYVSYDLMSNPGVAAQPVKYDDYLDTSIKTRFVDGGRGIDYDDRQYFNNRMKFDVVYVTGSLANTTGDLFIDSDETGFNLSNYRASSMSTFYTMHNDDNKYFKFVNSTDLMSYLFDNDVSTDTNSSIDCVNIKNLTSGKSIAEYVDVIVNQYFNANQSGKTSDLYYSTDYILDGLLVKNIYNHVLGNVLNWTLSFPITNSELVKEKLGYYPITKINSSIYDTVTGEYYYGDTIYSIFDFLQKDKIIASSLPTSTKTVTPSQIVK